MTLGREKFYRECSAWLRHPYSTSMKPSLSMNAIEARLYRIIWNDNEGKENCGRKFNSVLALVDWKNNENILITWVAPGTEPRTSQKRVSFVITKPPRSAGQRKSTYGSCDATCSSWCTIALDSKIPRSLANLTGMGHDEAESYSFSRTCHNIFRIATTDARCLGQSIAGWHSAPLWLFACEITRLRCS